MPTVNDIEREIRVGDVITMKAGDKHTVVADEALKLIEVQIGKEISVQDKIKHKFLDRRVYLCSNSGVMVHLYLSL